MTALFVALGGTFGVLLRYGLTVWVQSIWTIAGINLLGSFLLGLTIFAGVGLDRDIREGIGIGFIGGFTTLSTLTVQTVLEADAGNPGRAALYLGVNVVGGVSCALIGYRLGQTLT